MMIAWMYTALIPLSLAAQCPDSLGIVLSQRDAVISFDEIAHAAAPILWFSPDEPRLYDKEGLVCLPEPFPHDDVKGPVVYYKVQRLFSSEKRSGIKASRSTNRLVVMDTNISSSYSE